MSHEPFWDELGIAWQAISPAPAVSLERMKARFRRETSDNFVQKRFWIPRKDARGEAGIAQDDIAQERRAAKDRIDQRPLCGALRNFRFWPISDRRESRSEVRASWIGRTRSSVCAN